MTAMLAASIAGLALLVFVHVVTPSLTWLAGTPRSIWLSVAGGVPVACVFVHFMPEPAAGQAAVARAAGRLELAERHIFIIALAGLIVFYGLDRMVQTSRSRRQGDAIAALTAFLGGGVVLNVIKEEVPSERQSRFWAFAPAAACTALLLAL